MSCPKNLAYRILYSDRKLTYRDLYRQHPWLNPMRKSQSQLWTKEAIDSYRSGSPLFFDQDFSPDVCWASFKFPVSGLRIFLLFFERISSSDFFFGLTVLFVLYGVDRRKATSLLYTHVHIRVFDAPSILEGSSPHVTRLLAPCHLVARVS